MTARGETALWLAQRASAAILAVAVSVHLGTIVYAMRGGLSAAEIVARVGGNGAWLAFYGVFVLAAAVHAPIGVRTILGEMTALPARLIDGAAVALALLIAWSGWGAAFALYAFGGG